MQNIFIAIGGSGTKVAEALVRLLAIGFPTRQDGKLLTSAGDSLQIWRLDPDKGAQAGEALQACATQYQQLQLLLGNGRANPWSMELDPLIRHLDPLDLGNGHAKGRKSLRGLLNSGAMADAQPLLSAFYQPKELDIEVDKGFYQKPFIGAPVMAMFVQSLKDENSPGGRQIRLHTLAANAQVRFFLCGSLHGGTGASGVPVMAQFLHQFRRASSNRSGWRIGGCLLAPYCVPKHPPFDPLEPEATVTDDLIQAQIELYGTHEAFAGMTAEQKRALVRQILEGFFADKEAMIERTRQMLRYYQEENIYQNFDDLYLLGKAEPDELPVWSNGGSSQKNPLNSAEVGAALAALDFFADSNHDEKKWLLASSTPTADAKKLRLHDLPKYRVNLQAIDPERVFLATALMQHFLQHQIPWDKPAKTWEGLDKLRAFYLQDANRELDDKAKLPEIWQRLAAFILSTLDPATTLGWEGSDANRLAELVRSNAAEAQVTAELMHKPFFKREPKGEVTLGQSSIKISTQELAALWPEHGKQELSSTEFTRGHYFRFLWTKLYHQGINPLAP